jgi:hypothetical protein
MSEVRTCELFNGKIERGVQKLDGEIAWEGVYLLEDVLGCFSSLATSTYIENLQIPDNAGNLFAR